MRSWSGVEDFGIFCRLVELPVEGLIHVTSLADDYYYLESGTHTLVGRSSGRRHRLGDRTDGTDGPRRPGSPRARPGAGRCPSSQGRRPTIASSRTCPRAFQPGHRASSHRRAVAKTGSGNLSGPARNDGKSHRKKKTKPKSKPKTAQRQQEAKTVEWACRAGAHVPLHYQSRCEKQYQQ